MKIRNTALGVLGLLLASAGTGYAGHAHNRQ